VHRRTKEENLDIDKANASAGYAGCRRFMAVVKDSTTASSPDWMKLPGRFIFQVRIRCIPKNTRLVAVVKSTTPAQIR
jgi:hypothetical protein